MRQFIPILLFLTSTIIGWPNTATSRQSERPHRIGILHVGDHVPPGIQTLQDGLRGLGYEDGKNIQLEIRNLADEDAARRTAGEFVTARLDLIVAFGNPAVRAVKPLTSDIPIVMVHVTDPVAHGFAQTLARPGGNLTGFVFFSISSGKQVELFSQLVPRLRRLLVLVDPRDPATPTHLAQVREAASILNLTLVEREATDEADLERVFGDLRPGHVDGVISASPNLHIKFTTVLIRLASNKGMALASYRKEAVYEGALFSYAPDIAAVGHRVADYGDRILKGARPADLPIQQPTKFELVINVKVAHTLGIEPPPALLALADEVIE